MSCENMVIVFSGFRDDSLKKQIEDADGEAHNTLVKNATHILAKSGAKPSKKLEDAKKKGIEILDLDEFLQENEFHLAEKKKKSEEEEEEDAPKKSLKKEKKTDKTEKTDKKKAPVKKAIKEESEEEAELEDGVEIDIPESKMSDLALISMVIKTLMDHVEVEKAMDAMKEIKRRILA
jgi:outer membrane biosynthesis protein TonB